MQATQIKCDRNDPCSHCKSADIPCITVRPLPPRRRKREPNDHLSNTETMTSRTNGASTSLPSGRLVAEKNGTRYIEGSSWMPISEEVSRMRYRAPYLIMPEPRTQRRRRSVQSRWWSVIWLRSELKLESQFVSSTTCSCLSSLADILEQCRSSRQDHPCSYNAATDARCDIVQCRIDASQLSSSTSLHLWRRNYFAYQ